MPPKTRILSFIVSLPKKSICLDAAVAGRDAQESVRRRRPEPLAVREHRAHELAAARAVLQRMEFDRNLVARLDAVTAPSAPGILGDGLHFERPFHRLASLVWHHHVDPDMRIGPFEFLHDSGQGHRFLAIEHGEGMMRQCGRRDRKGHSRQTHGPEIHRNLLVYGAFGTGNLCAWAPRRLPSGSVAATSSPPREPSFNG